MRVVIIGGGTAGTTCAFELRKLNKEIDIIILEQTNNYQYSPCALPYVLSGEIANYDNIFLFEKKDYEKNNIEVRLVCKVNKIDQNKVYFDNEKLKFDKLVLATGALCVKPQITGLDDVAYQKLKTIEDARNISENIKKDQISVVIGAGMIGVELAMALRQKNNKVYLLEKEKNILPNMLDNDIALELKERVTGLNIIESVNIEKVENKKIILSDQEINYDKLYVCTGLEPNTELALNAGIKVDKGIVVNEYLETSLNNVYACGDCIEVNEHGTNQKITSQLGSLAVKQAQTVAKNILEEKVSYPPVLNNVISKVNDFYVGAVGLTEERAKKLNIEVITVKYSDFLRAKYYSINEKITIKLIVNDDGIILGSQIIGDNEVAGRLDLLALAISEKMTVKKLSNLETCYNPGAAPIFDPIVLASLIADKKVTFLKNNL